MRNTYLLLLLVVVGCVAVVPVEAENETLSDSGNAFVRFCSSMDKQVSETTDVEKLQMAACSSYVMGLDDGVQLELSVLRVESKAKVTGRYCYSGGIEGIEQLTQRAQLRALHPSLARQLQQLRKGQMGLSGLSQ